MKEGYIMKSLTSTAIAALAVGFLTVPAYAADLGNQGDPTSAAYARPESFTGFYFGAHAGYGNANHDTSVDFYGIEDEELGDSVTLFSLDGLNSRGFVGGADVGVDKQVGRFVFGAFASYDWSNMETEAGIFPGVTGGATYTLERSDDWSVGGRAGILIDPSVLIYALAAYSQVTYTLNGPGVEEGAPKLSDEETFSGVKIGGGMEALLVDNIFVGIEYTHFFGGEQTWFDTCRGEEGCGKGLRVTDDLSEDIIKGTLKYKFGGF